MYTVEDLMTRELVTLNEQDNLGLAESILSLGRIRHLPVVRGKTLVGLVTHRDVIRALATSSPVAGALARGTPAGEVMTRQLTTVTPRTPLRKAAQLMLNHKFGCLPVVDDGALVGILTEADLVKFAVQIIRDLDRVAEIPRQVGHS